MSDPTLNNRFVSSRNAVVEESSSSDQPCQITTRHQITDWRPAKLLCKRFNLRDPYKSLPDVQPDGKMNTSSSSSSSSHPSDGGQSVNSLDGVFNEGGTPKSTSVGGEAVELDLEELEKEFVDPLQNVKQADVDLFSELFGLYVCWVKGNNSNRLKYKILQNEVSSFLLTVLTTVIVLLQPIHDHLEQVQVGNNFDFFAHSSLMLRTFCNFPSIFHFESSHKIGRLSAHRCSLNPMK